jgi:release factor glutamine methyltransferase
MKVGEALKRGERELAQSGVSAPRLESEVLIAFALGVPRERIYLHREDEIPDEVFEELLNRRKRGEPMAYITGVKCFFGREFDITRDVLIPRPETETLIETVLHKTASPEGIWADIGTGSGVIAITLSLEKTGWQWVATDVSVPALLLAQRNARKHSARVHFVHGDGLTLFQRHSLSGLVSNPPYVDPEDKRLAPEVRAWEPAEALFTPGGTAFLQSLIEEAPHVLKRKGVLCVEFGMGQEDFVARLLRKHFEFQIIPDLAGIPRVAFATLRI